MNREHKILDRAIIFFFKCRHKKRGFSSFLFPSGIHLFPVPSSLSPLMSLFVMPPSLLLFPLFRSVYLVPRGSAVLFFCRSSGHKAKESPRQPSVYKAFCHVNKDKHFPSRTSQIPNSNIAVYLFTRRPRSPQSVSSDSSSACLRVRSACLRGRARRKPPCFRSGIIDLTNCRPCFILRK